MIRVVIAILFWATSMLVQGEALLLENQNDCFIVPSTVTDVGSPVRGVVAQLLVDRGDKVSHGQAIAELHAGTEQIMVAHAEARATMQSELSVREADLELAKLELERITDMHKQRLAPTQQLDEARARKKVALSGVVQALENQKLLQIELQRARHELAQRTLRSPANGVVVEQFINPGEFIYDEPVMSIAALDVLRVEVVLPARLFGSVTLGSNAIVTPELNKSESLNATVDVVDELLDTRSATFGVRLALNNQALSIVAGQKCTVEFLSKDKTIKLAEESN